jgi:heme-degrading monooxygenase HmoA
VFERYSERARRVLFSSRYEALQLGADSIERAHLMLGVLREDAPAVLRFADAGETADTIRKRLEPPLRPCAGEATTGEIPFSPACKLALLKAAAEADDAGNQTIRPVHLLLGILVDTVGPTAVALQSVGIHADAVRQSLRGAPDDPPASYVQSRVVLTAHAIARGVVRQWKGVVKPGLTDEYLQHLRKETIPALSRIEGFVTVSIMSRDIDDGVEFQVSTYWQSLDAIKAFAGDDVTRAVVPPAARALMVRYDERAVHYEIVQ